MMECSEVVPGRPKGEAALWTRHWPSRFSNASHLLDGGLTSLAAFPFESTMMDNSVN